MTNPKSPSSSIPRLAGPALLALALLGPVAAQAADDTATTKEVVITASRVPVPARTAGSSVTVIGREELEDRQIRIVSDVLRDVPGVAVSRSGPAGTVTQLRIRGAEGNHTLVLIDGVEVNNPSNSSEYNFSNLLDAEIARVEVLRGPQSALYGSEAIGGVVNIVTKRPARGFEFTARGEGGSFATWNGLTYLGYGGERFWVTGMFQGIETEGVSVADARNGNTEADGFQSTTGRIKAGIQPLSNLEFDMVAWQTDADRESDTSIDMDTFDTDSQLQQYGRIGGKLTLADGAWEHIANVGYMNDVSEFFNAAHAKTFHSEGEKAKYDYQTNLFLNSHGGEVEHTITLAAEHEWEEQFTNSAFSTSVKSVENDGYVAEYRVAVNDRVFLSGSVRHDDNDELFSDATTWRGTAAYLFETGERLHGSIGTGVKNPTLFELFGSTPTFTGNSSLSPETSQGWDIGVEVPFWDGKVITDVTYFHNRITDLIQGNASTATNLPGISTTEGVEVTVSAEPVTNLRLDAAYTYLNAQDPDGTRLIRRARHIASLNATYDFRLDARPATFNTGLRYNGDQSDTAFDSSFTAYNADLNGYALLHAAFSWKLRDNVELFARGENLLDQHYQEVFGYGTSGIAAYAGIRINLGTGAP